MINFLNCSQFFLRFLLNSTQTMLLFFFYYYSKYYSSYQFPRENFSKYEISILKSSSRRSFIPDFCFISKRDESQERNDEGSKLQTCRSFFKATRVVAIFGGVYSSRKGEGEGGGVYRPSEKFRNRSGGATIRVRNCSRRVKTSMV